MGVGLWRTWLTTDSSLDSRDRLPASSFRNLESFATLGKKLKKGKLVVFSHIYCIYGYLWKFIKKGNVGEWQGGGSSLMFDL